MTARSQTTHFLSFKKQQTQRPERAIFNAYIYSEHNHTFVFWQGNFDTKAAEKKREIRRIVCMRNILLAKSIIWGGDLLTGAWYHDRKRGSWGYKSIILSTEEWKQISLEVHLIKKKYHFKANGNMKSSNNEKQWQLSPTNMCSKRRGGKCVQRGSTVALGNEIFEKCIFIFIATYQRFESLADFQIHTYHLSKYCE